MGLLQNLDNKVHENPLVLKSTLFFNIVKIQRWYRKLISYNEMCPISREIVRYPCWGYKNNGKRTYYNVPILIEYFCSRGDFRDPVSRSKITLKHINEIVKYFPELCTVDLVSVYNSKVRFQIEREIEEQIDVLEDNFRTLVNEIIMDLNNIQSFIDDDIETNVDLLLSPKICELKICSGILSNMSNNTHLRVVNWGIEVLSDLKFVGDVEKIKVCIIEVLEDEFSTDDFF